MADAPDPAEHATSAELADSAAPSDGAGPPELDHRHLRRTLEFAVALVDQGQKLRPPLTYPPALKPFLKSTRLPGGALGKVRRAIEADPSFRHRLGRAAVPELVDPIGLEWLRRDDGWEQRVADLVAAAATDAETETAERARHREVRRREAAELVAARSRAEVAALGRRVAELEQQLAELREAAASTIDDAEASRAAVTAARTEARHANDRAEGARMRLSAAEGERDAARARADAAEAQRDALLAARAERGGESVSAADVVELRDVARAARTLADRLGALLHVDDPSPLRRSPLALPGGVARDSRRAAEHLVGHDGVLVLVDGYNVGLLAWPGRQLIEVRDRLLDVVDDLVRRTGVDVTVVFDGAEVVGAHAPRRHLARVRFSPAGVTADDVIRAEVAATPPVRPVVVVTDDAEIRRDVAAAGANLVASQPFLDLARR